MNPFFNTLSLPRPAEYVASLDTEARPTESVAVSLPQTLSSTGNMLAKSGALQIAREIAGLVPKQSILTLVEAGLSSPFIVLSLGTRRDCAT